MQVACASSNAGQLQQNHIDSVLAKVSKLPTLPTVYQQIVKVADAPRSSAKEISDIIEMDQALTANVLRLVNSAFYGFSGEIATVQHAVVILGGKAIKNLSLSACVMSTFGKLGQQTERRTQLWRHSLAVGMLAEELCRKVTKERTGEIFAAGILHDIGRVVLDLYYPEEMSHVIASAYRADRFIVEEERDMFGVSHSEVGATLAHKWRLTPLTISVIGEHHTIADANGEDLGLLLVHVANHLAASAGIGAVGEANLEEMAPDALTRIGVSEDDYIGMLDDLPIDESTLDVLSGAVEDAEPSLSMCS